MPVTVISHKPDDGGDGGDKGGQGSTKVSTPVQTIKPNYPVVHVSGDSVASVNDDS